jgi:hypothetical protein
MDVFILVVTVNHRGTNYSIVQSRRKNLLFKFPIKSGVYLVAAVYPGGINENHPPDSGPPASFYYLGGISDVALSRISWNLKVAAFCPCMV